MKFYEFNLIETADSLVNFPLKYEYYYYYFELFRTFSVQNLLLFISREEDKTVLSAFRTRSPFD